MAPCNIEFFNVDESQNEVNVGIPSTLFHGVLMDMRHAATEQPETEAAANPIDVNELSILIRIKETQLVFYTINKRVSLHKEAGEYEISGAVLDKLLIIKLGFCHLNSYLNAALLSDKRQKRKMYLSTDEVKAYFTNGSQSINLSTFQLIKHFQREFLQANFHHLKTKYPQQQSSTNFPGKGFSS